MPKVSILVPVYKAEKTLDACVESILAQTFQDFELLLIDDVGGTAHRLTGVLHLREGDDVADGVLLEHQHDHAVQAVGHTAVRRRTELVGVHQETEALAGLLLGKAEGVEHTVLQCGIIDTHRAAAHLDTVQYDVVGHGMAGTRVALDLVQVLGLGQGERGGAWPSSGPPAHCTQTAGNPRPTGS